MATEKEKEASGHIPEKRFVDRECYRNLAVKIKIIMHSTPPTLEDEYCNVLSMCISEVRWG